MATPSRAPARSSASAAEQVTPAVVLMAIAIGCALIGVVYYLMFLSPLETKTKKERSNKPNLERELTDAKKALESYNDDLAKLKELQGKLETLNNVLPADADIPGFLRSLTALCQANGIQIKLIQPQDEKIEPQFVRVRVLLKLDGEYLSLARFFNSVAQLPRVINMENITLSEPSVTEDRVILHATVTATTFRALAEDEKPKPADDKTKPGTPAANNAPNANAGGRR